MCLFRSNIILKPSLMQKIDIFIFSLIPLRCCKSSHVWPPPSGLATPIQWCCTVYCRAISLKVDNKEHFYKKILWKEGGHLGYAKLSVCVSFFQCVCVCVCISIKMLTDFTMLQGEHISQHIAQIYLSFSTCLSLLFHGKFQEFWGHCLRKVFVSKANNRY